MKNMFNPNELIHNESEVYIYVKETDDDLLDFSIVTESSLQYDIKMLTEDCADYVPYFLEFLCDEEQNESAKKLVRKYTGKWVEAKLQNCTDEDNPSAINGTLLIPMPFRKQLVFEDKELDKNMADVLNNVYD